MKLKKGIILFTILSLTIFTAMADFSGTKVKTQDEQFMSPLMKQAQTEGFVRVMVEFEVPDLHKLTTASNRYKTGNTEVSYVQNAYNADLQLENTIAQIRDDVLCKLSGKRFEVNHTYSTLPYVAMSLSPGALTKLNTIPGVLSIVEDRVSPAPRTQSDINESEKLDQPQLRATIPQIGADDAWNLGYTGKDWYVAILDTGIRKTHEMFQGKKIVEQCYSTSGDCPNGKTSMSGPGSAAHYDNQFDHGSHVAGIAAGNNHDKMFGVAKDAGIIAIQVFSFIPSWGGVGSYYSDQVKALEWLYTKRNQYKIASANMSLGGFEQFHNPCDAQNQAQKAAIDNLKSAGIATVVSSGNKEGSESICSGIVDPACISSAVSVGATTKNNRHTSFSYYSKKLLDLMAPGDDVISVSANNDNSYQAMDGTSMAAPHVAGAWAVLKQFNPNLSVNAALKVLKDEGFPIDSRCDSGTKPRIDIAASIMSLLSLVPPVNFSGNQHINQALLQTEYINILTWEANPLNAQNNQNIVNYRIYSVDSSDNLTLLSEVSSNTFSYNHRMVTKDTSYRYAIKAVNQDGDESIASYTIVN